MPEDPKTKLDTEAKKLESLQSQLQQLHQQQNMLVAEVNKQIGRVEVLNELVKSKPADE